MRRRTGCQMLLAAALGLTAQAAHSADITVDAGGTCTLAEAITSANNDNAARNGCASGSGEDTITLETDVTLAATLPQITTAITINGRGYFISGNNNSSIGRVLRVASGSSLVVNQATISGGNGGGIYNQGSVTLNGSTISGNIAANGGGIYNIGGTVMLTNSTISNNSAGTHGGGIYNKSQYTVTLINSTVSSNSANANGGGIYNYSGGPITLINSTVSSNSAGTDGGGICNADSGDTITLINSTVSSNSAGAYGGGICTLFGSAVTLRSSIISGNNANLGSNEYSGTTIAANSYNVFGHSGETSAQAFDSTFTPGASDVNAASDGDAPTALSAILNPTLAYNGGLTKTHALPAGSPAVDLGAAACPNNLVADQRGYNRPINFKCDAGAVEYSSSFSTESGTGRDLPASTWLMTAPSCTPGPDDIAIQYGDDIPGGVYGTNWISYKWDAAAQSYGSPQAGTDVLLQGAGNWLYSLNAATLALTGTATPTEPCSNYGSGLSGNCFAIDLTPSAGTALWQIVGHPFPYAVSWADVRVATFNGSTWTQRTPSQAAAASIMAKEMWRWSGSTYETKDDATGGLIGTLQPQEAVWVRMLTGSSAFSTGNFKLLVPAR